MSESPSDSDLKSIEQEELTSPTPPPAWEDPLEDLFLEAKAAVAAKRAHKRSTNPALKDALDATEKRMRDLFLLPENWERTRGVALIHRPSSTLIGNYSEYQHKSVPGCRKLLLEHQPIAVSATEYVEDSWYLGEIVREHLFAYEQWQVKREATIDVQLPDFGLHSPGVKVTAFLAWGGIMRVELAEKTIFASPNGDQLLLLPQHTNIIEAMSLDSKLNLRRELAL